MTEDTKLSEQSVNNSISGATAQADIDDILDLTETDIIPHDEEKEELIDIKSFDETGDIKTADMDSQLLAKAQHGNVDAIAELSKKIINDDEDSTTATPAEESQDGVDALLNNLGQLSQEATPSEPVVEDSLSAKAEQLEEASKTYAEKTFEPTEEEPLEEVSEETPEPTAASQEDIAKAMADLTKPSEEEKARQAEIMKNLQENVSKTVQLKAIPGMTGLQVGFPIEVLAEAIRPMIADWIEDNLPILVEKLVKEELSKLADK